VQAFAGSAYLQQKEFTLTATTGDKVQLGDTSLVLEVERDFTVYGDGKVICEGMGPAAGVGDKDALDCVITNALVVC